MVMVAKKLSEVQYDEARHRLRIWHGSQGVISPAVHFARYLATRDFCIERIPDGFVLGWQLALRDFRKERSGLPQAALKDIWASFFVIAAVIFPPEFVPQIHQAYIQLKAQAKKEKQR